MYTEERTLLTLVSRLAPHIGRSEATISNWCTSHGRLFERLRSGKGMNVRTYRDVLKWFSENWPEDLEWPEGDGIEARPAPTVSQENSAERKSA